jgi:elongator complex protein 3
MKFAQKLNTILRQFSKDNHNLFSRSELIAGYTYLLEKKLVESNDNIIQALKLKPIRTISGIIPITVLTKPYPCPGKCIFCPNDIRMPKSYIASEPGAQRALRNAYDPYLQTYNRLLALANIGHTVDKVELIILGGTWSFYPKPYQIWFVKRCFEAMNDFGDEKDQRITIPEADFTDTLADRKGVVDYNIEINKQNGGFHAGQEATWNELIIEQNKNVTAKYRCVGLVLETRPDYIDKTEVINLRRLGATKIQIGIQSLDNKILQANQRGVTVNQIKRAFRLLRTAGFKIHAHWMPNLYGATVESDKVDYLRLWELDFAPDELKIYPTSIIKGTVLSQLYEEGKYRPYTLEELTDLLKFCFEKTPRYARLTRVIRDIPSDEIQAGNKKSNLRQIVEMEMAKEGKFCSCIRCREIQDQKFKLEDLEMDILEYETSIGKEKFISYKTQPNDNLDPKLKGDRLISFLRLCLVDFKLCRDNFITELSDCAVIREVHVYGKVEKIGSVGTENAQHMGLGKQMILKAEDIARKAGYKKLAVISAIGTREYYSKLGYKLEELYLIKEL